MTSGVLLVDKPSGLTSHDVVARARRALGTRKVGHAGTLDPMATGLLLLGVDSATRLLTYLVGLDKAYTATIRLGRSTTTDDAEGEPSGGSDASGLDRAAIDEGIAALTGEIEQVPSAHSAIKVEGRRAYDRARAGETVELKPRAVTVSAFVVADLRRPPEAPGGCVDIDARIEVSSGTYVRAIARDLGAALGVGGHLTALRRTRVGPFPVDDAVAVRRERDADPAAEAEALAAALRDPAEIASAVHPALRLDDAQVLDLIHGRRVDVAVPDVPVAAAVTPRGRLAGLVEVVDGRARVLANFPAAEVVA